MKASISLSLTYAIGTFPEVIFLPSDRRNPYHMAVMVCKNGKFYTAQLGSYKCSLIQDIQNEHNWHQYSQLVEY